ncbi:aldo/keto reductase [Salinarimonas sp.]|uniref:aldo/keto reductase n=1 Tax=Salinarimonas sp. TaxID=2766526 RepID=UPI00391AED71
MTNPVPRARLGRTGLTVSRIALGAMMFGGRTDEAEAARIFDEATAAGVDFVDTADNYNAGRSEEIVGRLLRGRRHDIVLATKLGNPMGSGPHERGLSRRWILEETERSLRRLGVETIDILYLRKEDHGTPLEETVRAIADLVRARKVRYLGVSNHRAWRVARIANLCDEMGIDRPAVCQLYYHAFNRMAEIELIPACTALGIGVYAYSPLARGVLTGKYRAGGEAPADSRAASGDKRILETEYHPAALAAAERLRAHCEERGIAMADFAAAWILANPQVTGLVAGPRTLEQWHAYLQAPSVSLAGSDEAFVDALVPPGTTAIPHHIDPAYAPAGRASPCDPAG